MAKIDNRTKEQRRKKKTRIYSYEKLAEFGDLCPLCQKEGGDKQDHHCLSIFDGGDSSPWNLLRICRTCHATIEFGNDEDSRRLRIMIDQWQLSRYGLLFALYVLRRHKRPTDQFKLLVATTVSCALKSGLPRRECDMVVRQAGLVGLGVYRTDDGLMPILD